MAMADVNSEGRLSQKNFADHTTSPDSDVAQRAMEAMMIMKKIYIAAIESGAVTM